MTDLRLPWRVVQNWRGKIAIVDATNNGKDTGKGRVCNIPLNKGRGLEVAQAICEAMNAAAIRARGKVAETK